MKENGFAKQPTKDLGYFRDVCPKCHVFKLLQIKENRVSREICKQVGMTLTE